jgi:hypothetical protein
MEWLVYEPETETIIERGFADNVAAERWVTEQIANGVEAARGWIICQDAEGFGS